MANSPSKESLKRQNYFDLKRDEIMAMDEYLLSPISEIDLRKMNEGGIASIENMTGPIGMAGGGNPMDELLSKRASLVGMINAERGVPGVLGGGMDEEKLRVLQIELDQIDRMISMIQGKGEQ